MRLSVLVIAASLLAPLAAGAQTYRWVDEDGNVHYGDKIPAKYAELPKDIVNDHGVAIEHLEGKKSEEELEAERIAAEIQKERELRRRKDLALLATYGDVEEILMHRDRRVELFQAQARVTELYLRNTQRRLDLLESEAARFKPYSADPSAPMIDPNHVADINETRATIERHQSNLKKYESNQQEVISRFDGDIARFKTLKGIDD